MERREQKPPIDPTKEVFVEEGVSTIGKLWEEWESSPYWIKQIIDFQGYCDLRRIYRGD